MPNLHLDVDALERLIDTARGTMAEDQYDGLIERLREARAGWQQAEIDRRSAEASLQDEQAESAQMRAFLLHNTPSEFPGMLEVGKRLIDLERVKDAARDFFVDVDGEAMCDAWDGHCECSAFRLSAALAASEHKAGSSSGEVEAR